jgi:hypothetical protein
VLWLSPIYRSPLADMGYDMYAPLVRWYLRRLTHQPDFQLRLSRY